MLFLANTMEDSTMPITAHLSTSGLEGLHPDANPRRSSRTDSPFTRRQMGWRWHKACSEDRDGFSQRAFSGDLLESSAPRQRLAGHCDERIFRVCAVSG